MLFKRMSSTLAQEFQKFDYFSNATHGSNQRVRNGKKIPSTRDFQVYIDVNSATNIYCFLKNACNKKKLFY